MKKFFVIGLVSLALAWPASAVAAPIACSTLIAGHIAWMAQGGGQLRRRIGAKFARVKITSAATAPAATPWGHISFAEGAFGRSGSAMQGRFLVTFPGRADPAIRDVIDITLTATGTGVMVLRSWDNTRIPLAYLRCDGAGFLNAIEREDNGISMITLSFRRETF